MTNSRYYIAFDSFLGRWYWTGFDFRLGFQYAEIYKESNLNTITKFVESFNGSEQPVFYGRIQPGGF
jgi:hypothetical protein